MELYDRYYSTCFQKTKMLDPRQTLRFYDACFEWCLPKEKNLSVLDFGAGLGNLMFWLKSKGFNDVSGIDISKEQCEMAKKISQMNVEFCLDPLAYLESHKENYAMIFMSDVLEHIPKREMLIYLKSIFSALKPGGIFVVKTDNISSPTGLYQLYMDFTHEYCFTEQTLAQLLGISGFEQIIIKGEPMFWTKRPWNWWKPVVRQLYWLLLRILYEAEQPRGERNPRIFSKSLIARCNRPIN